MYTLLILRTLLRQILLLSPLYWWANRDLQQLVSSELGMLTNILHFSDKDVNIIWHIARSEP